MKSHSVVSSPPRTTWSLHGTCNPSLVVPRWHTYMYVEICVETCQWFVGWVAWWHEGGANNYPCTWGFSAHNFPTNCKYTFSGCQGMSLGAVKVPAWIWNVLCVSMGGQPLRHNWVEMNYVLVVIMKWNVLNSLAYVVLQFSNQLY